MAEQTNKITRGGYTTFVDENTGLLVTMNWFTNIATREDGMIFDLSKIEKGWHKPDETTTIQPRAMATSW